MKKILNVRLTALLLVLCCVFGSFAAVPAYAMEYDGNSENTAVCEEASVMPRAGHDTLYYGQVVDILDGVSGHKITVTGSNLTPYKTVENDPRMHRVIFNIGVKAPTSGSVLFRISIQTQYHGIYESNWVYINPGEYKEITNNPAVTGIYDDWDVSMGEHISFLFECSSSADSVEISKFDVYCD